MSEAAGFLQLEPRGVTNDRHTGSSRNLPEPATAEQVDQIEQLRSDFLVFCGKNSDRPLVRYARLLNKVDFVLDLEGVISPDAVKAVLCDRSTLFSPAYAEQQQNHQIARESRDVLGKTTHEQQESALKWLMAAFPQDRATQAERFQNIIIQLNASLSKK